MKSGINIRRAVPNFFTFGNMVCGFLSMLMAVDGKFESAAWLIGIAAISDALDGIAARLTKTSSQFGVELDSIADVVSFGVAPAFLVYMFELRQFSVLGIIASVSFLMGGGFRLARFNAELVGFNKKYFKGLPIPVAAATAATFVLYSSKSSSLHPIHEYFPVFLMIALALLMISHIKYDTIPNLNAEGIRKNPVFFVLLVIAIAAAVVTGGKALFFVFSIFVVFGIFKHVINLNKG